MSNNPYRPKPRERQLAIALRQEGLTYNEILDRVDVAKSTLSLWLQSVGLAKPQKQRTTLKRRLSRKRGQIAIRRKRIEKSQRIIAGAKAEIGKLSHRELWLIGIALYWAEGSKKKLSSE